MRNIGKWDRKRQVVQGVGLIREEENLACVNAGMPRSNASTDSESPAGIPSSC